MSLFIYKFLYLPHRFLFSITRDPHKIFRYKIVAYITFYSYVYIKY